MANDRVFIRQLVAETIVGVYDWEQSTPRNVVIDLDMATDIRFAAHADDITKAINYAEVSQAILDFCATSRLQLIETLAEQIAALVINTFDVSWLRLELAKPGAVPEAQTVGVVIERTR